MKVENKELIIEAKVFGNSVQVNLELALSIPLKQFSKIIVENIYGNVYVLADLKVNDFMITTKTEDVECDGHNNSEVIKVVTKVGEIIRNGILEVESNNGDIETNMFFFRS